MKKIRYIEINIAGLQKLWFQITEVVSLGLSQQCEIWWLDLKNCKKFDEIYPNLTVETWVPWTREKSFRALEFLFRSLCSTHDVLDNVRTHERSWKLWDFIIPTAVWKSVQFSDFNFLINRIFILLSESVPFSALLALWDLVEKRRSCAKLRALIAFWKFLQREILLEKIKVKSDKQSLGNSKIAVVLAIVGTGYRIRENETELKNSGGKWICYWCCLFWNLLFLVLIPQQ